MIDYFYIYEIIRIISLITLKGKVVCFRNWFELNKNLHIFSNAEKSEKILYIRMYTGSRYYGIYLLSCLLLGIEYYSDYPFSFGSVEGYSL